MEGEKKKVQMYLQVPWVLFVFLLLIFSSSVSSALKPTGNYGNGHITRVYRREFSLDKFVLPESVNGELKGRMAIPGWEHAGNVSLLPGNPIRLFSSGSLWNSQPVSLDNWEFQLQFQMSSEDGKIDEEDDESRRGLVFWYTREKNPQGVFTASSHPLDGLLILVQVYRDKHKVRHSTMSVMVNNVSKGHYEEFDLQVDGCWGHNLQGSHSAHSNHNSSSWLKIQYQGKCLTVSTKLPVHELNKDTENDEGIWASCFGGLDDISLPPNFHFGITPFPLLKSNSVRNESSWNYLDILEIKTFELQIPPGLELPCTLHVKAESEDSYRRKVIELELTIKVLVLLTGFLLLIGFYVAAIRQAYRFPPHGRNLPTGFY